MTVPAQEASNALGNIFEKRCTASGGKLFSATLSSQLSGIVLIILKRDATTTASAVVMIVMTGELIANLVVVQIQSFIVYNERG